DMYDESLNETGMRVGEYYYCVKESLRPCVGDPVLDEMGGARVMLSSFTAPILLDGRLLGIVGSDLSMAFLPPMLAESARGLYEGKGEQALLTPQGRLVAWTGEAGLAGGPADRILDADDLASLARV